jgi:hypothetical protein
MQPVRFFFSYVLLLIQFFSSDRSALRNDFATVVSTLVPECAEVDSRHLFVVAGAFDNHCKVFTLGVQDNLGRIYGIIIKGTELRV